LDTNQRNFLFIRTPVNHLAQQVETGKLRVQMGKYFTRIDPIVEARAG